MTKVPMMSKRKRAEDGDLEDALNEKLGEMTFEILEALYQSAIGHWYEDIADDGEQRRVYRKSPNGKDAAYLLDRKFGRPTERKEQHTVNENYDYAAALQARRDEYAGKLTTVVIDTTAKELPMPEVEVMETPKIINNALADALRSRRNAT